MAIPLLEIDRLNVAFPTAAGPKTVLKDVSLRVNAGEIVGIVGESGSGKSVTAMSVLKLLSRSSREIRGGRILFEGRDLLPYTEKQMRGIRGKDISMIFQEPMTSLNPTMTCGAQIAEAVRIHEGLSKKAALEKAVAMLELVGIPSPELRAREYPHRLSGGMRQRVMIAMALVCRPKLLIADEPTTALDVTIQAQIMELMKKLRKEFGMAIMLITHDMGVVAEMAERVAVMYAGGIVEESEARSFFRGPRHPYTQALLKAMPRLDDEGKRFHVIEGTVPGNRDDIPGCSFHNRCPVAIDECSRRAPPLEMSEDGRKCACWLHSNERMGGHAI